MEELITDFFDNVIIIGNGFDLNIGLETSYSNFVKSDNFKSLIENDNKLVKYLNEIHNLQNWIDIENELKRYSKKFPKNKDLFTEFKELSKQLSLYLNNIEQLEFKEDNLSVKLIKSTEKFTTLIIDFNYTNSIELISKKLNIEINGASNIQHIKIHGSLEKSDTIFGVEDDIDLNPKHVFLKKSVNKNFNPINFSKALSNCKSIIIFGHSIGETDHMYFEDYFRAATRDNAKRQKITIFHYGEESFYDLNSEIDKLTLRKIRKLKHNNKVEFIDTK